MKRGTCSCNLRRVGAGARGRGRGHVCGRGCDGSAGAGDCGVLVGCSRCCGGGGGDRVGGGGSA